MYWREVSTLSDGDELGVVHIKKMPSKELNWILYDKAEYLIQIMLNENFGLHVNKLARVLKVTEPTVSPVLCIFSDLGLVKLIKDGKKTIIKLTPKGLVIAKKLLEIKLLLKDKIKPHETLH